MAEPINDDKTVVRVPASGGATAPAAGPVVHNALPIGTRLGEFEIVGLVGEGGFGIVYLAEDRSLQRKVAVKEYMPSSLAGRGEDASVVVRSSRHQETFEIGRRSFVNEAQLLAQFDHPALVKVYRFWEANGTAYMAMPYYKGKTLRDVLKERAAPPDESWIKKILVPVMEALEVIHQEHCYHRDIAPDNIMLLADERPVLLDFGAARRVISDMTQALTVILKPGYAPIEQYAEMPGMKQGPWTDIYALAAVVYFMITARTPPPSVGRMMQDSYQPLAQLAAGRYSEAFLRGIDKCLSVKAEERPQSMAEMREVLGLRLESPLFAPADAPVSSGGSTTAAKTGPLRTVLQPTAGTTHNRRNGVVLGVVSLLGIGIVGGGYWYFTQRGGTPAGERIEISAASAPVTTPAASAPTPSVRVDQSPAVAVVTEPPRIETAVEPPKVEPPASPAYPSLASAVSALSAASDARLAFKLDAPRSVVVDDKLRLSLRTRTAGYLYLFLWDKAEDKFYRLFPNRLDTDNALAAGASFSVPRTRLATPWNYAARSPAGEWQVMALLSAHPRDFSRSALGDEGDFLGTTRGDLESRLARREGLQSFIGTPQCGSAGVCDERYAVSVATIAQRPASAPPPPKLATPPTKSLPPSAAAEPPQAAKPARQTTPSGDRSAADAEREYMRQLNRDLDKLLGK